MRARSAFTGKPQRSEFDIVEANASLPSAESEGADSSAVPNVIRSTGPFTCQVREDSDVLHRLAVSPLRPANSSLTESWFAAAVMSPGPSRVDIAAIAAQRPDRVGVPPSIGVTHKSRRPGYGLAPMKAKCRLSPAQTGDR